MAIKVPGPINTTITPERREVADEVHLEQKRLLKEQLASDPIVTLPFYLDHQKGVEQTYNMDALKVLFGRAARMGSSAGQTITSTPIWPGNSKPYGYNKQQADIAVQSTKVVAVRREWLRWPTVSKHDNLKRHVMGCCVCKTKTPANTPWWKPFRIMKVVGLLKKDFPYKDIYSTSRLDEGNLSYDKRDYYFAVCSEGCENFIYLALLDV